MEMPEYNNVQPEPSRAKRRVEEGHSNFITAVRDRMRTQWSDKQPEGKKSPLLPVMCLVLLGLILTIIFALRSYYFFKYRKTEFLTDVGFPKEMTSNQPPAEYNQPPAEYNQLQADHNQLKAELNQMLDKYSDLTTERDLYQHQLGLMLKKLVNRPCPGGWIKFQAFCFYKTTEAKTWQASREECLSRGGDLVVIDSTKRAAVNHLAKSGASWIGLYHPENGDEWKWVDGSLVATLYWVPGRPNTGNNMGNCVVLGNQQVPPGEWFDVRCCGTYYAICEI